jgi:hypothetical protein
MNIPSFLIRIVVLEVLALLTVIWGLWILFTHDFTADELDRTPVGRRAHTIKATSGEDNASVKPLTDHTSKSHESVATEAPAPPTERDDSGGPVTSGENPSDEIDPRWPAPTPKSS